MIYFIGVAVNLLLKFLEYAILADVILSWVFMGRDNGITQFIHTFTDPFTQPFKKIQDRLFPGFMIDFSPFFAILVIEFLNRVFSSFL